MFRKLAFPLLLGWSVALISAGLKAIDGPALPVDELALAIVVAAYGFLGWAIPEPTSTLRKYLASSSDGQ